tara:strand:- start:255 stop:566 length:312 start_codon:yes stop_codon:yes gene_type:complete
MKRPVRDPVTGTYDIKGKIFKELFGSREQVWNGTAYKTKYGLTKSGLVMNKRGRIVSADKHESATKEMRLKKYGYSAKKGKFGYVKTKKNKNKKNKTKKKGKK